ncbi:MAG: sugar ABC transporter ATP-binding protein [Acidimicrobiia bacterium]|nr:sugar ABC transporter ATP-binding protein [Acidimicrobiia bacterium]
MSNDHDTEATIPLLEARSVAKSYGPVVALRSADLAVRPGEIHALLGANGAGKSTLVKALSGVFPPTAGEIVIAGDTVRLRKPSDALARGIATVFQDPALVPDLTVSQNLALTGVDESLVTPWLEQVGLAGLQRDLLVREIPLEQLRLIDLARALAGDPQVLLLDEITAALPADQAEHVFGIMQHWRDRGRAVLFITHRLAEVRRMCDRATVLRDGRDVASLDPRAGSESTLIEAMLGDEVVATADRTERSLALDSQVALEARGLSSGDKVNDVSFQIRAGEIVGIAALEGQGQERLFDLLSGDRRPSDGEIFTEGKPLRALSPYDAVQRGVVLVPSDRLLGLLPQQSVRSNIGLPLYRRARTWLGLDSDEPARVDDAIERLDIDTRAQRQVNRLSGGNQQKVVIARWLATGFRTLLCFDPTRGIDLQTKRQLYELLRELADDGAAILLYTSELPEIPLVCDRVLVLYDGKIVAEQDAADATEESMLSAAHGLGVSA